MPRYSEERRPAVVAKLLPPNNLSGIEAAEQEGISVATICKWRKEAREQGFCLPDAGAGRPAGWTARDKFPAMVETATMNAEEVVECCRRRGLYPEHIQACRRDCEQAISLSQKERRREALEAKATHRARWSGKARNWAPVNVVSLNPDGEPHITPQNEAA